jgi:hypothetical protein
MKLNCLYIATCLSSYFSEHHLPHVQILVHKGMTLEQVKEALHDEVRQDAFAGDWEAVEEEEEGYYEAAHKAIEAIFLNDGYTTCFDDLEEESEDDTGYESVYAFFCFEKVED